MFMHYVGVVAIISAIGIGIEWIWEQVKFVLNDGVDLEDA